MKVLTVVGARPQFVKAAAVSQEMRAFGVKETLVHTGQHYDDLMSGVFFDELDLREPQANLGIHGGSNADMTGRMLCALDEVVAVEDPDLVLVYGDTNSTAAAAVVAKHRHIELAHVEAGLRSGDMRMPEEVNRILTDRLADRHYCPSEPSVIRLRAEGIVGTGVVMAGDVMLDIAKKSSHRATRPQALGRRNFALATLHRPSNVDDAERLDSLLDALNAVHEDALPVVAPLHPRTHKAIVDSGLEARFDVLDPVGYFEMMYLIQHAAVVVTDSGGVQKEAFFHRTPCVTVRDTTEWTELLDLGVNKLAGPESLGEAISDSIDGDVPQGAFESEVYGTGRAGCVIVSDLLHGH